MMDLKTKRVLCLMVGIASILTIVGTISYAYFTAVGEMRPVQATINTATVSARFADNDTGITGQLSFGESLTKKFTITNTGTAEANVKMYFQGLVNTYLEDSLTYTLSYSETEEGAHTEVISKTNVPQSKKSSNKILADSLTIPVGKTYYYNLTVTLNYLNDVNQDADLNAVFYTDFNLVDINYKEPSFSDKIAASSNGAKTEFADPALTDEGIFEMEDDYGTSYYYRGAVTNNYVKFGKWNLNTPVIYRGQYSKTDTTSAEYSTLQECQNASSYNVNCTKVDRAGKDMYWRIIRVNGDGSLRIIYDGTEAHANGSSDSNRFTHTGQPYNSNYNDVKYLGWLYGPAGTAASTSKEQAQTNTESSAIKKTVDEWYKTNIEDAGYGSAVADVLFCNDRSTPGKDVTGFSSDTGLGYGKNYTAYGVYARLGVERINYTNVRPTFKCPEKNDAFTVSDEEKGNGALTYPVGLITADEIVAAGSGKFGTTNKSYYLYRPIEWYWSMSPYLMDNIGARVTLVHHTTGQLTNYLLDNYGAIAPVINISVEYANKMIGDGTIGNEYRVE